MSSNQKIEILTVALVAIYILQAIYTAKHSATRNGTKIKLLKQETKVTKDIDKPTPSQPKTTTKQKTPSIPVMRYGGYKNYPNAVSATVLLFQKSFMS